MPATSSPMLTRAGAVARMHLVDRTTLFLMPASVLAAAFVINIAIWSVVPEDGRQTGGAASVHFFVLAAAMFAVVRGLPFALGMGASRRAFVLGTGLTGLVLAVVFGTAFLLLGFVERLTDGWWLHGRFFVFPWFEQSSWPVVWLMLVLSVLAAFVVGAGVAGIYARWSTPGLVVAGPGFVLALGAIAVLLTWRHGWTGLGHWFGGQTPLSASGWLVLGVVLVAAATWGELRRARA